MDTIKNQSDHDLLIELRTEMRNIRNDIKELKESTTVQINILEKDKADQYDVDILKKKVNEDVEGRIRCLEEWRTKRQEQIEEENNKNSLYFKITVSLGIILLGMFIWHLTGFHI